jgi:hypothetical protein
LLGAQKGQLVDGDSSGTDSEEDIENSDEYKLTQVKHAITGTSQPMQVIRNGKYQWEDGWERVSYCRTFLDRKVPEDILEPLRITANAIRVLAFQAGSGDLRMGEGVLPLSIQLLDIEREALEGW